MRKGALLTGIAIVGLALVSLTFVSLQRSGDSERAYIWPMAPWPASDREWMAAIEKAKRNMNDPETPWPEPWIPPWVRVVRSCSEAPVGRLERTLRVEYSPGNARKRVLFDYDDFRLILYSDQDLSECPEHAMELLEREHFGQISDWRQTIERYACDDMLSISQGMPPALAARDPTVRLLPSQEVAQAYREAFCQEPTPTATPYPRPPTPTPTQGPSYSPTMAAVRTALAIDGAKPRFFGELGDFEVKRPAEVRDRFLCSTSYTFKPVESPEVHRSEIYFSLPGFKSRTATMCKGQVIYVMADKPMGGVSRGYYSGPGKLKVGFQVPRDRIQLLTVGGRPAIAQLPYQGALEPHVSVWVIQRHPTPTAPGITASIFTDQGLDYAVALLEQVLAQGPR